MGVKRIGMCSLNSPEQWPEKDHIILRLNAINNCAPDIAYNQFKRCCGSSNWVDQMVKARPFSSIPEMIGAADRIWANCSREDWLEAFAAHPKIGSRTENQWSRQEQLDVATAPLEIQLALDEANQKYEAKFGYIFIVCAAGKIVAEILSMLYQRLHNAAYVEIQIAAEQQRLITRLRLIKLLSE
jgi:OHCU decarboxylase